MFDTSSAGHIQAGDEPLESALRELEEELGIHATPEQLHFAGTFPISFAKEFHGKMFRDEELAFVYIYDQPVDITELILQKRRSRSRRMVWPREDLRRMQVLQRYVLCTKWRIWSGEEVFEGKSITKDW